MPRLDLSPLGTVRDPGGLSVVYVARRSRDGAIKIGTSERMRRRLLNLGQRGGSLHRCIAWIHGDVHTEHFLHARLRAHLVPGEVEYFVPTPAVLRFVNEVCEYATRAPVRVPRYRRRWYGDCVPTARCDSTESR